MGPSRPVDPPVPTVMALMMAWPQELRPLSTPPCAWTAAMTSAMPCWRVSGQMWRMAPTTRPPKAGTKRTAQPQGDVKKRFSSCGVATQSPRKETCSMRLMA